MTIRMKKFLSATAFIFAALGIADWIAFGDMTFIYALAVFAMGVLGQLVFGEEGHE